MNITASIALGLAFSGVLVNMLQSDRISNLQDDVKALQTQVAQQSAP